MSKAFRDTFNDGIVTPKAIREFCYAPGAPRDKDGKILYVTEQAHKDRCDVNNIVDRYKNTGVIDHVARLDALYGDVTAADYKTMMDKVVGLQAKFLEFPAKLRDKFGNDPAKLLDFLDDPKNKEAALELGIVRDGWDYSQVARDAKNQADAEKDSIGE